MTEYETAELELDGIIAYSKALRSLTDVQRSKLTGFIVVCQRRGLTLIVDGKRRVYLEPVNGTLINGDVIYLFLWI